jgi:hypothetical protein
LIRGGAACASILDLFVLPAQQALPRDEIQHAFAAHGAPAPEGDAVVFWLTTSYGADLVSICREVDVRSR